MLAALVALAAGAASSLSLAPAAAASDPFFPDQWALAGIGAPAAWSSATGQGVKVGLVDTGVDLAHEDLGSKVALSADCSGAAGCTTDGRGGLDDNGHGTHMAGIIAAATGNFVGMAGVAPNASLVVAKALDAEGRGSLPEVERAIRWVVDQGARVVNLSIGPEVAGGLGAAPGESLQPAISYAWERGAVAVIAAGNDGGALGINYRSLDAVVVGASSRAGTVASYSSGIDAKYGIVAPGGDGDCRAAGSVSHCVLSTFAGNHYAVMRGTSVAAPHVAGALALVMSQGLSRDQAVRRILDTANRSVGCGPSCAGLLDVAAATGAPPTAPSGPTGGAAGGGSADGNDPVVNTPAEVRGGGDAGPVPLTPELAPVDRPPAQPEVSPAAASPEPPPDPAAVPPTAPAPPPATAPTTAPATPASVPAPQTGSEAATGVTTTTTTSPPADLSAAGPVVIDGTGRATESAAPKEPPAVRLNLHSDGDGTSARVVLGLVGFGLVVAGTGRLMLRRRLRAPV